MVRTIDKLPGKKKFPERVARNVIQAKQRLKL